MNHTKRRLDGYHGRGSWACRGIVFHGQAVHRRGAQRQPHGRRFRVRHHNSRRAAERSRRPRQAQAAAQLYHLLA
jgi:hypothetical protein